MVKPQLPTISFGPTSLSNQDRPKLVSSYLPNTAYH